MKLFIVATFIAVASAARLEHLERSYLPPDQGTSASRYGSQNTFGSQGQSSFGSGSFGASGSNGLSSHGSLSSGFGSNGIETPAAGVRSSTSYGSSAYPGATINQYLPPDHGPSASNTQFSGSLQGFGNQRSQYTPQSSFGAASQYSPPSTQYGTPALGSQSPYQVVGNQFGSQGSQRSSQFPATSRQYLAPKSSSNYPQQPFDEQTGYHY